MRYEVKFVDDESLPSEVEYAFVRSAGRTALFVKQSAIDIATGRCDALTRAWTLWQQIQHDPRPRIDVRHHFRTRPAPRPGEMRVLS